MTTASRFSQPARAKALLLRVAPWLGGEVHGGALRSQQIAALVARALPDVRQVIAPHHRALGRAALATLALASGLEALRGQLSGQAFFTAFVDRILRGAGLTRGDLVIYDADPRYGPALARVAARRGLRVLALPHNVEALIAKGWPMVIDAGRAGRALAEEVGWLAQMEQVWCIGRLDCDIFQLFGIKARHLPYVPPPERLADLLAIRARREQAGPGRYLLILGTAHNTPTRAGMLEQLALARDLPPGLPVRLAGYGTEALACDHPRVQFMGAQDWPSLQSLLAEAAALWVHQAPMSGALTRIPEALAAGVPVLANGWGARGHGPLPGLSVYEDGPGLAAALQALPAEVPVPDFSAAEQQFIKALAALASG